MAKKKRKYVKDVQPFLSTGLTLGVGSEVLGRFSSPTATHAQQGLGRLGRRMPTLGTVVGAGWVLGGLKDLTPKPRRKKKKR